MAITITIRDNQTGEERSYGDPDTEWSEGGYDYQWSDGNFGCDCNRALFFARAVDQPEPDVDCGEERYSVLITNPAGAPLFRDGFYAEKSEAC